MELIEITIDSKSTMFNLGSRNQLANKFIYGIKIFNAYGVSPTGKVNANNITPFMQKAFITIQDSNGTIKIKDLPVSSCWDATGNPMYIEKMKINFEKSYFKLPSLLLTNANAEIPSNTVVMLEIYYE
ncbi:MAG: hypothetical protein HOO91_17810 [Bacteroidales bacterium]|nr:hypothetical protein [Bacteroidales bacterium]